MMLRPILRGRIQSPFGSISCLSAVGRLDKFLQRCASSSSKISSDSNDHDKQYSFLYDLPYQFLRASNIDNFDESTSQRKDVVYNHETGKPESRSHTNLEKGNVSIDKCIIEQNKECKICWSDGTWSYHNIDRLKQQYLSWKKSRPEDRILWSSLTENDVRQSSDLSISFQSLVADDGSDGMGRALKSLYQYGILLVTETPVNDDGVGVATLGAALSGGSVKDNPSASLLAKYRLGGADVTLPSGTDGPLRTLYGKVWATTSGSQPDGTSVADSAYGNDALPLHTDMTYLRDPPGLQIFTMVQPARVGGESVFCDGFAVADTLRTTNSAAFDVLRNTSRSFHSLDNATGWNLRATGPVIQTRDGRIVGIRHNDLDRLPDLPPEDAVKREEMDAFYEALERAHANWDSIIAEEKFRLVMKLGRGDTMVVANQVRVFLCTTFSSFYLSTFFCS